MRLIVLGPPGAGKGTQIAVISKHFNVKSISTGDLLRENIKNETKVGKLAKEYVDKGELVPSDVINQLVENFIVGLEDGEGFILDGYPRNYEQALALKNILSTHSVAPIEKAIYIKVGNEEVIKRLSGRLTCSLCGAIYHKENQPPQKENICDICGGELIVRPDDTEEAIKNRLVVYENETAPLVDFYEQEGILYTIDGSIGKENVSQQLINDLSDL